MSYLQQRSPEYIKRFYGSVFITFDRVLKFYISGLLNESQPEIF